MQQKSSARGFRSGPRCGAGKCAEAHLGLSVRGREWTNTRPLAAQERLCLTGRPSSRGSSGCSSLGGHQGGARPCCAGGSAGRLQELLPHLLRPETTWQDSVSLKTSKDQRGWRLTLKTARENKSSHTWGGSPPRGSY